MGRCKDQGSLKSFLWYAPQLPVAFLGVSDGKESACKARDPGLIPGSGRAPGEGNGNPLQHFGLENPMDRGAWRVTVHGVVKSQTRLSNYTHFSVIWGRYTVFSYPESPQVHHGVGVGGGNCLMAGILFPPWVPSGLTVRVAVMWWLNGCNTFCFLICQAAFLVHIQVCPSPQSDLGSEQI